MNLYSTEEIANIQFTSGTTGMPKAAAISHSNIVNNVIANFEHQNSIHNHVDENMIICNVLPLYHVFSFTGASAIGAFCGAANIFPGPGFNPGLAIEVPIFVMIDLLRLNFNKNPLESHSAK